MEAFLVSTGLVAIAEIGDKTQLLAMILAARFRRPVPIILGILAATILNHTLAAALGVLIAKWLSGTWFQAAVGAGFVAMAIWALVPDKDDEAAGGRSAGGVFLTTLVAFFLIEIGDKTQIATTLRAARDQTVALVAAGTTLGMMLANAPVVWFGDRMMRHVPVRVVHLVSAAIFLVLGVAALAGWG